MLFSCACAHSQHIARVAVLSGAVRDSSYTYTGSNASTWLCLSACGFWHSEIWVNCETGVEICEGLGVKVAVMEGYRQSKRGPCCRHLAGYCQVLHTLTQVFLVGVQHIRRELSYFCVHPLKPSGHYMFNIQQLYVLPTHCVYVFCVDLRTNSHYFPIQH